MKIKATRVGINPTPTVAECCKRLIINMLHASVGVGFIPTLAAAGYLRRTGYFPWAYMFIIG